MASINKEYKGVGIAPNEENNDWIKDYCEDKDSIREIELTSFTGHGGLSAEMKKLQIHYQNGTTKKYIYKTTAKDRQQRSQQLGLSREAYFYHYLADKLRQHKVYLPKVIYVHGDVTTGEKTIILEDLSETSVQSGYFFGPSSPHNWGKDLPQLIAQNNLSGHTNTMEEVAIESFKTAARLHGTYWLDHSLLDYHWLRGSQWVKGEGEISWVGAQQTASNIWANTLKKIENGESKVKWNDLLISCVNSSFSKVNWEKYQEDFKHRKWTLVHGDFHPANIMWKWINNNNNNNNNDNNGEKSESNQFYDNSRYQDYLDLDEEKRGVPIFLDFEMVGIGNGAQDLAQYLISHMAPADRRSLEDNLIQKYHNELLLSNNQLNDQNYSFEECKKDYVEGGALRWVWLLAALSGMCPDPLLQYFQDQLAAFFIDHSFTPENIGMPRV